MIHAGCHGSGVLRGDRVLHACIDTALALSGAVELYRYRDGTSTRHNRVPQMMHRDESDSGMETEERAGGERRPIAVASDAESYGRQCIRGRVKGG